MARGQFYWFDVSRFGLVASIGLDAQRLLGHVERDAAKVVGFELGGAEVVHERERGENERSSPIRNRSCSP
jgi:hypothetical protein